MYSTLIRKLRSLPIPSTVFPLLPTTKKLLSHSAATLFILVQRRLPNQGWVISPIRSYWQPPPHFLKKLVPNGILLGAASFSYVEQTDSPELPKAPLDLPNSHLSHEFLIRQSCAISVESSSQFLTHVVMAIEDALNDYILHMSELANLYEDSVMALTEEGAERVQYLKTQCGGLRNTAHDQELLFHFVEKLFDSSAEVCFLAGAEFASVQASQRIVTAKSTVKDLFDKSKLLELEVIRAQQTHIEKVAKATTILEERGEKEEERRQPTSATPSPPPEEVTEADNID